MLVGVDPQHTESKSITSESQAVISNEPRAISNMSTGHRTGNYYHLSRLVLIPQAGIVDQIVQCHNWLCVCLSLFIQIGWGVQTYGGSCSFMSIEDSWGGLDLLIIDAFCWRSAGKLNWERTQQQAHNSLEGFSIPSGLGTLQYAPGRAGKRDHRERDVPVVAWLFCERPRWGCDYVFEMPRSLL